MRLGAIHRRAPAHIPPLAARARLAMLQAPPSADWHAKCPADGDDLGNGRYGCCVPAADYRLIQLRRANAWGDSWAPTTDMVLARYSALTGFDPATGLPDDGTDTAEDMQAWCSRGIRLDGQNEDVPLWTVVDPAEMQHVNLAIAHFGGVAITLALPAAAQDLAWDRAPGSGADWVPGSWGNHRVCSGKYDGAVRTVRTWGRDVAMHPEFWSRYVIAVDVALSREWLDATGLSPPGMDWDALREDAAGVA